jgi:hypothetical protein
MVHTPYNDKGMTMMKIHLAIVWLITAALLPWTQAARAETASAASPAPIEAFYCNMLPGKSMKDLMPVAERISKWADKNDPGYSAWLLTPQFGMGDKLPQVIWLGSAASGGAFGKGLDAWQATGGELAAAFGNVVDCSPGHVLASSVEISAPDGIPGDGVVMFTQCDIAEGSNRMDAIKAHKAFASEMRALGSKGSSWIFFPMLGGSDPGYDYLGVSTFRNWSDYFDAYETYVNGGGGAKAATIFSGKADCNKVTPTVWDVKLVRKAAS